MSRKIETIETAKSDLTGQLATQTRTLTEGGRTAVLDLTDREAAKFDEVIGRYFSKSSNVTVAPDTLREWANANGFPVGLRGRLSSELREAYHNAVLGGDVTEKVENDTPEAEVASE